jgi:seryl-tRNA synthetase
MLDVKWIRENPGALDEALRRRGLPPLGAEVAARDQKRRAAQTEAQRVQAEHNQLSKEIGIAKAKGQDAAPILAKVGALKARQAELEEAMKAADRELEAFLAVVPNAPAPDVPEGKTADDNPVVRRSGPIAKPGFPAKQHFELGEALGLMDFEQAGIMSGARFTILKGALARLERALAQFMLDLHTTEFGYTEVSPPLLVRDKALYGTANLPKFEADLFATTFVNWDRISGWLDEAWEQQSPLVFQRALVRIQTEAKRLGRDLSEDEQAAILKASKDLGVRYFGGEIKKSFDKEAFRERLFLIPTAEVPLTNLAAGKLLDEKQLPLRFTAWTPCFRSEAGAAGKDTRGMLRQHQFYKVELVSIAHPEKSEEEHERMTACAEAVLTRLGLPFRTVMLCTGDMGFASKKTYDIEVWLPGQGMYREISSCSNCGDFQARRMDARFRPAGQKGTRFVHTLNGSGIAVGRALIAVMENYQRGNGSIEIPGVLRPYMGGMKTIAAPGAGADG